MNVQEQIERELVETISVQLKRAPETIDLDGDLYDKLLSNSLDYLSLILTVEQRYSLEVGEAELSRFKSVRDIARYVGEQLAV